MSSVAQELMSIVDGLPEEKAREVVDFARFLQQQSWLPRMGTHPRGGAAAKAERRHFCRPVRASQDHADINVGARAPESAFGQQGESP
jgi:hypothetical protein